MVAVLRLRLDNYTADPHHGLFLLLRVCIEQAADLVLILRDRAW